MACSTWDRSARGWYWCPRRVTGYPCRVAVDGELRIGRLVPFAGPAQGEGIAYAKQAVGIARPGKDQQPGHTVDFAIEVTTYERLQPGRIGHG